MSDLLARFTLLVNAYDTEARITKTTSSGRYDGWERDSPAHSSQLEERAFELAEFCYENRAQIALALAELDDE